MLNSFLMDFSQANLEGFAPKDKKIIKDNPNATLLQLAESGLSDKAYSKLEAIEQEQTAQLKQQLKAQEQQAAKEQTGKIEPVQVKTTIAPRATPPNRLTNNNVSGGAVWLLNANTGLRQYLSRSAAEKLVRMNPKIYKIVG